MRVDFQNDRYTVGGKDIFDNLADLVEHFKRTGIEELSGTMVYLKQVRKFCNECFFFFFIPTYMSTKACSTKAPATNQLLVLTTALWKLTVRFGHVSLYILRN